MSKAIQRRRMITAASAALVPPGSRLSAAELLQELSPGRLDRALLTAQA